MTTSAFALEIGCSRPTIYKVKNNLPVCTYFSKKISMATNYEIIPKIRDIGVRGMGKTYKQNPTKHFD